MSRLITCLIKYQCHIFWCFPRQGDRISKVSQSLGHLRSRVMNHRNHTRGHQVAGQSDWPRRPGQSMSWPSFAGRAMWFTWTAPASHVSSFMGTCAGTQKPQAAKETLQGKPEVGGRCSDRGGRERPGQSWLAAATNRALKKFEDCCQEKITAARHRRKTSAFAPPSASFQCPRCPRVCASRMGWRVTPAHINEDRTVDIINSDCTCISFLQLYIIYCLHIYDKWLKKYVPLMRGHLQCWNTFPWIQKCLLKRETTVWLQQVKVKSNWRSHLTSWWWWNENYQWKWRGRVTLANCTPVDSLANTAFQDDVTEITAPCTQVSQNLLEWHFDDDDDYMTRDPEMMNGL